MKRRERNPVSKALKTLGWLIQTPSAEAGVREMAAALGLSPSNAHNLLTALVNEGFVQQDPRTARYALGPELLRWAHLVIARTPLRQVALEHMRRLVEACNETAVLGVYNRARREMMFAVSVDSTHPLRYAIALNEWIPVHTGASGLAIMAFLPDAEIRTIIQRTGLEPMTPRSITKPKRLLEELKTIRRNGYALSHGQRIPGAVGLAAPVFGSGGEVVGDVNLTIPEQRFDERASARLLRLLSACAAGITAEFGGARPRPEDLTEWAAPRSGPE